tara:strand:- start:1716 stop:2240 length:525 start_codon:yes stop_codon:yes gene_type:complete
MARTFTLPKKGTGQWNEGWHTVTINKAKYGELDNGAKYIDVTFKDYPDNFNMRVYAKQSKDGEEFAIANLFRFANAGITDALESATGETVVKLNDDPSELENKMINAYFYKNGQYTRVLPQIAPVQFKNIVEQFHEKDIIYFKGKAEAFFSKWVEPKLKDEPYEKEEETNDVPF